ncbi:MAG: hypothetical protein JJU11_02395 [Candidatus Sumerlaeia bacterium]|nr:hypothetical protein [Candidatus Sumerlaeia bacterium]
MRNTLKALGIVGAAAFIANASPLAAQSQRALDLVPADTEFLAHVDLKALIDTDLFQTTLESFDQNRVNAFLSFAEGLSGTRLLEDIEGGLLFGLADNDDSIGVAIEGRLDRDKLSNLLVLAPRYQLLDIDGQAIHTWFDARENRTKYGTFLQNMIVVWNSREAMERSFDVLTNPAGTIGRDLPADIFGDREAGSVLRAGLIVRNEESGAARLGISRAFFDMTITPDAIRTTLDVEPDDTGATSDWEALLGGGAALFRIQKERPALAQIARSIEVEAVAPGTVRATTTISIEDIPGLIALKKRGNR